jgi:hypothetical protein
MEMILFSLSSAFGKDRDYSRKTRHFSTGFEPWPWFETEPLPEPFAVRSGRSARHRSEGTKHGEKRAHSRGRIERRAEK